MNQTIEGFGIEAFIQNPDFGIKMLEALKAERELSQTAQERLKKVAPSVEFARAVTVSKESMTVGEAAKILSVNGYPMGSIRLFRKFEEWGWVHTRYGSTHLPTQYPIELGFLELKYQPKPNPKQSPNKKTMVTSKGLKHIFKKLQKERSAQEGKA